MTTILEEAQQLIDNVKVKDYDTVDISFRRLAVLWSEVLGKTITEQQVAMCMIMLKLSREIANHKRDNLVDIAGYTYCMDKFSCDYPERKLACSHCLELFLEYVLQVDHHGRRICDSCHAKAYGVPGM